MAGEKFCLGTKKSVCFGHIFKRIELEIEKFQRLDMVEEFRSHTIHTQQNTTRRNVDDFRLSKR